MLVEIIFEKSGDDHRNNLLSSKKVSTRPSRFHLFSRPSFASDIQSNLQDAVLDLFVGSTKDDDEQAESRDPWRRLEHHARILKSHEERLESNITKIEIIREMLEQKTGQDSLVSYNMLYFF